MKQNEIAAVIIISAISVVIAYFVASALIGNPSSQSVSVKTIAPISTDVEQPDSSIFNKDAINPTVQVVIGDKSSL